MKTSPIIPASPTLADVTPGGDAALARSRQVFLAGNELPSRWRGRDRFVVLQTGFGAGDSFLATWDAWRSDPQRSARLVFIAIEPRPFRREDLRRVHADSTLQQLAHALCDAWPPLTPNAHWLDFEGGRVRLMLCLGQAAEWLPELNARVDAFFVDSPDPAGSASPGPRQVVGLLGRLAAAGATAASPTAADEVREGLTQAGFEVEGVPGEDGVGDMSVARFAPGFTPMSRGVRLAAAASAEVRHALVLGAGLAGAAAVRSLTRRGWHCTVLDRLPAPAQATSGNPAGLFHGVVTAEDGAHARVHRAAALMAERAHRGAMSCGVPGRSQGFLRLDARQGVERLHEVLARLGLPPEHVQAVDAAQASELAGVPLAAAAWHFPGGGWVSPPATVACWLSDCTFRGGVDVQRLQRVGSDWQALDAEGRVCGSAPVVVLANALDAMRLLAPRAWPVSAVRGQLSVVRSDWQPRLPLAGAGYAIGLGEGRLLCGATSHHHDADASVRDRDHVANLQQLRRLGGPALELSEVIDGRVGWRMVSDDRLPIVGPVPALAPEGPRLDQPRFVPREPGLYALLGLGSRGLTTAPLMGELLAAWITADPLPMEGGLVDVVDAARFVSRRARQAG